MSLCMMDEKARNIAYASVWSPSQLSPPVSDHLPGSGAPVPPEPQQAGPAAEGAAAAAGGIAAVLYSVGCGMQLVAAPVT